MSMKAIKDGKEYPVGVIPNGYPASNIKYANGSNAEVGGAYKSGDTVSIVRNVFPAWGGGNRKELAFWIPLDKTYGDLTPSLTGTVDIFEGDGTTVIVDTKDITDFSITYTYTNAYLYVNLRHPTNLFSAAGVKFILATALTLTFT